MTDTLNTQKTGAGNTKKPLRSRAWSFTLNNYSIADIKFFTDTLNTEKYMFQEETSSTKTKHLQGTVYFREARTFDSMKQLHSKTHWEKTKCLKGSIAYCCDESKRTGQLWNKGWSVPEKLKIISELTLWQKYIINLIKNEPDERTIHWIYDMKGNTGKTALTKFICHNYENTFFFTGGSSKDITYQIIKNKITPKICIFHFARTLENTVSYKAIESVKDGLVQCGKYEGGHKIFNSPHVIIFANWLPEFKKLSLDRWNIIEVGGRYAPAGVKERGLLPSV